MFYAIRHFTSYRYSHAVWQSMMEVRMHPRSEGRQRCFVFQLSVNPKARIFAYTDFRGNQVHHFDLPSRHRQLTIIADALVEIDTEVAVPDGMHHDLWDELEHLIEEKDFWDMLEPSRFARTTPELSAFAREIAVADRQGRSLLTFIQDVNAGVHSSFSYVKKSTKVNSPIEHALRLRQGVCQDFAHIMIALLRHVRIPCRYVSGYLYHSGNDLEGEQTAVGATHAWVEAFLPTVGWVGFDPTMNVQVGDRHIRTAVGRDYADVPPTMGTMKGRADTELQVRVRVSPSKAVLPPDEEFAADEEWSQLLEEDQMSQLVHAQQQQ
jgi:transglutaminase-like putative cysteine protease